MRTLLLGLAVAPALLVTPALAQDNPTFGQAMANLLGIQPNDFCDTLYQQSRARYVAVRLQPRIRISGRLAAALHYDYADNYGAYIRDVDGDNVADESGSFGSSSSSSSSSSYPSSSSSSSYPSSSSSSSSGRPLNVRLAQILTVDDPPRAEVGTGFYYIPGTQTCLRIGGYVRFQGALDFGGGGLDADLSTRAGVYFDTRTQTDYGTLRTYAMLNAFVGADFGGGTIGVDFDHWVQTAFIQLAGFNFGQRQMTITAGRLSSAFDAGPGYTYYTPQSNVTLLQVRGSVQLANGLALDVAVERQEERGIYGDIPVAFVAGFGPADTMAWRASAAIFSTPYGPGLAGQVTAGFDLRPNLTARVTAALSLNGPSYVGRYGASPGLFWGGNISAHYETATPIYLTGLVGATGGGGGFGWQTTLGVGRDFGPNTTVGAEISRWGGGMGGDWGATIRWQRNFWP